MQPTPGDPGPRMLDAQLGTAFFLSGDLYPKHERVETALATRLRHSFSRWVGQEESLRLAGDDFSTNIGRRLSHLRQQVLSCADPASVVLIGLSSGSRVATMLSLEIKVAATISLGYPFRHPAKAIEARRFQHLHRVSVPTLIIQGTTDRFGGTNITEDPPLSSSVSVKFVAAGHTLQLQSAEWDDVAQAIKDFCSSGGERFDKKLFDEDYYLRLYPDVAAEIGGGRVASGHDHYRTIGLREKTPVQVADCYADAR